MLFYHKAKSIGTPNISQNRYESEKRSFIRQTTFLVLHYRPGEALGDRADTGDCQPGGDTLQIVHGDQ